jgi:DNA-binding response OmpR family regulator
MSNQDTQLFQANKDTGVTGAPLLRQKIIIVDDDPGIRDIFSIILDKAGYDAEIINDGQYILKNKFQLPHLFLIDKQLSGINGLDVCRHLKQQESTMHIPVIMISASPDIGALSKEAGADAYMEKPFEITYLLKLLRHYALSNADTIVTGKI